MKGKKIIAILIALSIFIGQVHYFEIQADANPAVVYLTIEGFEALLTLLLMSGIAIDPFDYTKTDSTAVGSNIIWDENSNSYYAIDSDIMNDLDLDDIDFFNSVGASKNDKGFFDYYKDGLDIISDWYSGLFSSAQYTETVNFDAASVLSTTAELANNEVYSMTSSSRFYSMCIIGSEGRHPKLLYFTDDPDAVVTQEYETPTSGSQTVTKKVSGLSGYPGLYTYGLTLHYSKTILKCSGFNIVTDGEEFENSKYCSAYAYNNFNLYRYITIGDDTYAIAPSSLAEYFSKGLSVPSDGAWDNITDYAFDGDVIYPSDHAGTGTATSESVPVPITGISVPACTVDFDDTEGVATIDIPSDFSISNVKALTDETTDVIPDVADETLDKVIDADTTTDLGILQGLWEWLSSFFTNFYNMLLRALRWLLNTLVGTGSVDFSAFKVASGQLTSVFPFCVPYDMVSLLRLLNHAPIAPTVIWDFSSTFLGDYSDFVISVDFSEYAELIALFKTFVFIIFSVGLLRITRSIIRG